MRLQVLVVVKMNNGCDSKKEIIRLKKVIYKVRIASILVSLDQLYDNIKPIIILSLDNIKITSFSLY